MVIYTKSWLSGLGRDQNNTWDNILLNWLEANWTLADPPKYHATTAPFGVLFGENYNGQWDYVCYASIRDRDGIRNETTSIGGRHGKDTVYVTITFSVRKYNVGHDELPVQVENVLNFIENLVDSNKRGLQSEGIRLMELENINDGELFLFGQQIYEMDFVVKCLVSRINLQEDEP